MAEITAVFENPIISLRVDANRDFRIRVYELREKEFPGEEGMRRILEVPECVNELLIRAPEDLKPGEYETHEVEISYLDPKPRDANSDRTGIYASQPK